VRGAPPAAKGGGRRVYRAGCARRSKADAQASFVALQSKFPANSARPGPPSFNAPILAEGIYYRAMVGPFASAGAADQFAAA